MSRSTRAWVEMLLKATSPTKRLVGFLVASMLAVALVPASALARSSSSSQANPQNKQQTTHSRRVATAVLALGSGYVGHGSGRVRALQRRLLQAGYAPGPIDGRYGPRTEQAVIRFQAAHGLQVDGIAGPLTFAALSRPSVVLYPGAGYVGHGSGRVRALQRRLLQAGYAPGPIDGRYGPRTEQAVIRFQAAHGLQVDGIAGPLTFAHLGNQRTPHKAITRAPAGSRQRANHPTRGERSRPRATFPQARRAPATGKVVPTTRSTSSPSVGLLVLLVLVVALALSAMWLAYRRRGNRYGSADTRANDPSSQESIPNQVTTPDLDLDEADRAYGYGMILLEEHDDRSGATAAFERADQLGHGAAACCLGVLLYQQGERATAEVYFRRADERGDAAGAFNLAVLLEEDGDYAGALSAYQRADQDGNPEIAEMARTAALALETQAEGGQAEGGIPNQVTTPDLDLDEADRAYGYGMILLEEHDDRSGATAAFERADQLGHGAAACCLGVLLYQQGERATAEVYFRRADERGDAAGAFNLAVLLEEDGDYAGALSAYQRADQDGNPEIAEMARTAALALETQAERPTAVAERGGSGGS